MKSKMFDSLVVHFATLGPLGTRFPAPGTVGSFMGILFFAYLTMVHDIEIQWCCCISIILFLIGIPICSIAEKVLGQTDPQAVIWDEFSVIPLIFILLDESALQQSNAHCLFWLLTGFLVFRFFDVIKPLGIKKLQDLPGGWGVMTDDLAAALFASVFLGILQTFPLSFL